MSPTSVGPKQSALLAARSGRQYPVAAYGKGVYLYDTEGRRYLDGSSGAMTASIGHGVSEVAEAMARQARSLAFVFRNQFSSLPAEQLAARLTALAPGDMRSAFFVNSGSEATEYAFRTALAYWKARGRPAKTRVLGRRLSYHGMTLGALSLSGSPLRRRDYEPHLHPLAVVPPAYCYRCPFGLTPDRCRLECATAFETEILRQGPEQVAAVIVEPIVGAAGGAIPAPPGYLKRLRDICDRYEVLLIADEVITGIGRTGAWFACEEEGVVPDLLLLGKGLSGGYAPVAAILLREPIAESMEKGGGAMPFGHTFSANPLGAATCLAVLDFIEAHGLLANAAARGLQLQAGLQVLAKRHAVMADIRGRGLLWGFELVREHAGRTPLTDGAAALVDACLQEGLVAYPAGAELRNAVLIAPPLTISAAETEELLTKLDAGLVRFERGAV